MDKLLAYGGRDEGILNGIGSRHGSRIVVCPTSGRENPGRVGTARQELVRAVSTSEKRRDRERRAKRKSGKRSGQCRRADPRGRGGSFEHRKARRVDECPRNREGDREAHH